LNYLARVSAIAAQTNGRVLIGGSFSLGGGKPSHLARLNADGSLDTNFNIGSGPSSNVAAIAVQPDGKILIAGAFEAVNGIPRTNFARLNTDGSLDLGFNATNIPTAPAQTLAIQPDGKVLTGSPYSQPCCSSPLNAIARYRPDGSLEVVSSFPSNRGVSRTFGTITSILVEPDERILVAGLYLTQGGGTHGGGFVAKLDSDLSVDTNFTATFYNPTTVGVANALLLQPDGNILVGGNFIEINRTTPRNHIARLKPDGSVDTSFDPGTGMDGAISSMAFQEDGKFLVAGQFLSADGYPRNHIARLHPHGSVDTGFNIGAGPDEVVSSVVAVGDWIYAGGDFSSINGVQRQGVARLYRDCQSDIVAFTASSVRVTEFEPAALLTLMRTGCGDNSISLHYATSDGTAINGADFVNVSTNVQFAPGEKQRIVPIPIIDGTQYKPPRAFAVTLSNPGGGAILGAPNTLVVTIYDDEGPGSLDPALNSVPGTDLAVHAVAAQADGKEIIGGAFTLLNHQDRSFLARLNPDGSSDATFLLTPGPDGPVNAIALQPTGEIFIGGSFTNVNATRRRAIARLKNDGSVDMSFDPGSGVLNGGSAGTVRTVALQADGKLLMGGVFDTVRGIPRSAIARLHGDGTLDEGFLPPSPGGECNDAKVITLQPDGKIIVGGCFTGQRHLFRLNTDGSPDAGFVPIDTSTFYDVASMALQSDGRIVLRQFSPRFDRMLLVRLNPDGTLDPSISAILDRYSTVQAILVQPDGKFVLAGNFTHVNGIPRNNIARLNTDGSLDLSFNAGPGPDNSVLSAAFLADGKLLIGGGFIQVDRTPRAHIAVINGYNLNASRPLEFNNLVRASDGSVQLSISTEPGRGVILQASSTLFDWVSITTNYPVGDSLEFIDSEASSVGRRFYRALRMP